MSREYYTGVSSAICIIEMVQFVVVALTEKEKKKKKLPVHAGNTGNTRNTGKTHYSQCIAELDLYSHL